MATQSGDIAVYDGERGDSTTTLPKERLHRVNTLPTSGYEVGGVYFVRSEGKIYIRTESAWECFDKASHATSTDTASKVAHSLSVNGEVYYDGSKDVTFTKTSLGLSNVENTADRNKKIRESNLQWDSQCLDGTVSPIDAAMIPTMGSNRFGFFDPSHIKVEYSTDAGETWIDYGATDEQKLKLVTQDLDYSNLRVGKATSASDRSVNGRLKITFFDFKTANYNGVQTSLYGPLRKFAIDVSTDGASNCWCTIRRNTAANPDVFTEVVTKASLSGWSGWNTININDNRITMYNNDASNQASKIEFIFGQDSFSSSSYEGLAILKLYAFDPILFGGSQYAKTGNVHSIDSRMNVTFPSWVIAKLDANSSRITNVSTPTLSTDAANKAYVDSKVSGGSSTEKQWVITSETTEIDASIWNEMKSFDSTTTSIPNIKFVDEFNHAFSVRAIRQNGSYYEILFTSQYGDYPQDIFDGTNIFMSCNVAVIGAPANGKCSVETECNEVDLNAIIQGATSRKVSSIKINGTTKTPNSSGLVDLGTISGGGSVTTDTSMSSTSTNPVQNKVIKSYVDSLVGTAITQLAQI